MKVRLFAEIGGCFDTHFLLAPPLTLASIKSCDCTEISTLEG